MSTKTLDEIYNSLTPERKRRFVAEKIMDWYIECEEFTVEWVDKDGNCGAFNNKHVIFRPDENLQQLRDTVENKAMEEIPLHYGKI